MFLQRFVSRLGVLGHFFRYLWRERMWWLIPMVVVLVVFGVLIVFSQSSAVTPFIYTLF